MARLPREAYREVAVEEPMISLPNREEMEETDRSGSPM